MRRALIIAVLAGCARAPDSTAFEERTLTQITLTEEGGRVDWSRALDLIAFDRLGDDGRLDVWTMRPDGGVQSCFTCELPSLPKKNVGQPAWHPSAAYLVVQADEELWAISFPDGEAFALTGALDGVGHPRFSPDGGKLWWSESTALGGRELKSADFVIGEDGPALENIYTLSIHAGEYDQRTAVLPDGRVLWIASAGEYWMANADGSGLVRLTRPGRHDVVADLSVGPDGKSFVAYVEGGRIILFRGL